jgi:DNA (cytosine-5)-methyltransferase 1
VIAVEGDVKRSRLITPRKAARLIGLPESYVLPASANATLHVAGEGVGVPIVRWLAANVLEPALVGDDKAALGKSLAA